MPWGPNFLEHAVAFMRQICFLGEAVFSTILGACKLFMRRVYTAYPSMSLLGMDHAAIRICWNPSGFPANSGKPLMARRRHPTMAREKGLESHVISTSGERYRPSGFQTEEIEIRSLKGHRNG
ncbi:hypothetical protein BO78DRAFT_152909 [Aspergillus sclerotiicarbonarius CBS 121057]|uniref:Uncharacterized protein n=1 Tax=Aspergillus sclerotiicarbonarius (strain CBS 121057 / IBT 28362) TaxID=1448318 RepID=A0A319E5M1_ASPSB|nr:hypothetical protein BO78DRAFT_152909 [Aspergillus sclerotiicarbonarius CBS 121057]